MKRETNNGGLWGGRLIEFESLPSTNLWAMENIASLQHGDVVRAVRQTAGRGRFDRKWFSPEDCCLTVSLVLKRPDTEEGFLYTLGMVAALSVSAALKAFSIRAELKWPNDALVGGRKISGILIERDSATRGVALGIGINVNLTADDLAGLELMCPATSMAIEAKQTFDTVSVLSALLSAVERITALAETNGPRALADLWRRDDHLAGKRVAVTTEDEVINGRYGGIDDTGRMRIVGDAGAERLFWTGDVSLRPRDA